MWIVAPIMMIIKFKLKVLKVVNKKIMAILIIIMMLVIII